MHDLLCRNIARQPGNNLQYIMNVKESINEQIFFFIFAFGK